MFWNIFKRTMSQEMYVIDSNGVLFETYTIDHQLVFYFFE